MKPFHFKNFSISQTAEVFRVGTDAVLLGALAGINCPEQILEIGTGTGIISMMLAQRFPLAEILAIDINENAVKLSAENFKNCSYSRRLNSVSADFNDFESAHLFDLIVCNPPYFEVNSSDKDILARQKIALNFKDLIGNTSKFLSAEGLFSVIIPAADCDDFFKIACECGLFLKKKINIFGIDGGVLKRVILEFSTEKSEVEILDFTVEKSPRKFSDQYLKATEEFHLFQK